MTTERPHGAKRLLLGAAQVGVIQGLAVVVAYLATVLGARWMGAFAYGEYAFAWNVSTLLATVAGFGLPLFGLREVSIAASAGDDSRARALTGFISAVSVGLATIACLLLLLSSTVVESRTLELVALGSLSAPATALLIVNRNLLKAWRMARYAHLTQSFMVPLLLVASAALLGGLGAEGVLLGLAGGTSALALVQVGAMRRALKSSYLGLERWKAREWTREALPLSVAVGARIAQNQIDILVLGLVLSPAEVGPFAASKRTALLIGSLLVASNDLVVPEVARRYARGDIDGVRSIVTRTTRPVAIVAVAGTLSVGLLGPTLLGAFSAEFRTSASLLWILLAGQLANVLFGPSSAVLAMTGHQALLARIMTATSALSVIVLILLTRSFGATGAAAASLISILMWNAAVRRGARREIEVDTSILGRHSQSLSLRATSDRPAQES